MDHKTRKIMKLYQALHLRPTVDRVYMPRKERGQGLLSVEEYVN